MDDVLNQAVTAAVIVAIGAAFLSRKQFWAKILAFLCFAGAVAVVAQTPALAVTLAALTVWFFIFKDLRKRKKAKKKSGGQDQKNVTVHVHNHN